MNRKKSREPYTNSERLEILKYIIRQGKYNSLRGNLFWKNMEKAKVVDRTWQSAKQHFKTYIVQKIAYFKIPSDEKRKILEGFNSTSKSKYTVVRPGNLNLNMHLSDDEEEVNSNTEEINIDESGPSTVPDLIDKDNKRKRDSSSSSSSIEIVDVYKQDTPKDPVHSKDNSFKKFKFGTSKAKYHKITTSTYFKDQISENKCITTSTNNVSSNSDSGLLTKKKQNSENKENFVSANNICSNEKEISLSKKIPKLDIIKGSRKQKNIQSSNIKENEKTVDNYEDINLQEVVHNKAEKNLENENNKDIVKLMESSYIKEKEKTADNDDYIILQEVVHNKAENNLENEDKRNIKEFMESSDIKEKEKTANDSEYINLQEVVHNKAEDNLENENNKDIEEFMVEESTLLRCNLDMIMDKADEMASSLTVKQISKDIICSSTSIENLAGPSKQNYDLSKLAEQKTTKALTKVKKNPKEQRLEYHARKIGVSELLVVSEFRREKRKRRKEKRKMKKEQNQGEEEELDDEAKVLQYLEKMQKLLEYQDLYNQNLISENIFKNKHFKCLEFIEKFYNMFPSESTSGNELMSEIKLLLKKDNEITTDKREKRQKRQKRKTIMEHTKGRQAKRTANKKLIQNEKKRLKNCDSNEASMNLKFKAFRPKKKKKHNQTSKVENSKSSGEESKDVTLVENTEVTTSLLSEQNTQLRCENKLLGEFDLPIDTSSEENAQTKCIIELNEELSNLSISSDDKPELQDEVDDDKFLDNVHQWVELCKK